MKTPLAKLIKFLLISTCIFLSFITIGCENNEQVISIKKNIKPLNNSNISGTITFTQENDSVFLEAHVFGLKPGHRLRRKGPHAHFTFSHRLL